MVRYEKVRGTQEKVLPLELNVDTVYIRKNIVQKEDEDNNSYWEYDETQLTFEEYFKQIIPEQEQAIGELTTLFAEYQNQIDSAIAELTIAVGEGTKDVQ